MSSSPDPMYLVGLEIAGVSISIQCFRKWTDEISFIPFMKSVENPDFRVTFRLKEKLPELPEDIIHEDNCYRIHPDGKGGVLRSFFDAPRDYSPYAVAQCDYQNGSVIIDCLPKGEKCVSEMHNSFFHIGFEKMLIHKKRLCLHAACVNTPLGGILFSGPSGIGKSTQSELWCRYRKAFEINGDRPILSKSQNGWFAWGAPYAGSSKTHVNVSCPVRAVVILQQAKECSLQRLKANEAFRAVWSELTVQLWDRYFVEEASNLTLDLVKTVPVFRFYCTPDENAVEYLERELRKECFE